MWLIFFPSCNQCNLKLEARIDDEHQFKTATSAWWCHCSETVFRNNFVIFRRRSKRNIAFLESVDFSTCVYMQIFNFRGGHVPTFRDPSGAYISQMPGHTLQTSKRHTYEVLASVPLVWGTTVSCRLCAGKSKGTLKTWKMLFLDLALPMLQNSGIFHNSTRPQLYYAIRL